MSKKKNCLQIALKKWEDNDRKGVIVYDGDHVQWFDRDPIEIHDAGQKYFEGAFISSLTKKDLERLSEYFNQTK